MQTIGLLLDVVGVLIIVNFFHKTIYKANSPYGLSTNMPALLTKLANEARTGSYFLVAGFTFQLVGVWSA